MIKIDADTLKLCDYSILQMKEHVGYVLEKEDTVYKIYKDERIELLKKCGIILEKKIKCAKKIKSGNIALPTGIIYENNKFVGYAMKKVKGIRYSDVPHNYMNLYDYARLYETFETILDNASENGIVITDFANVNNIFLTNPNDLPRNAVIIDYDDMQVCKHKTVTFSGCINWNLKNTPKYCKNGLYTAELNKMSLVYFYFDDVLCFKLKQLEVDMNNIYYSFSEACHKLGLQEKAIIDELFKIYCQKEKNPRLSEIFYELANIYELNTDEEEKYVLIKK